MSLSAAKSGEDGVEGSQPNPPQLVLTFSWLRQPLLPFQMLAASALEPATDLAFPKRTSCFRARTESRRSVQKRAAWINKTDSGTCHNHPPPLTAWSAPAMGALLLGP